MILQIWYYLYFLGPFLVTFINLLTDLEIKVNGLRISIKAIINMKNISRIYNYYEKL